MNKAEQYIKQQVLPQSEPFQQLEEFAKQHRVPIMEPVSMNFLTQLIRMKQPSTVLEIGTAIGYSALRMIDAYSEAHITTIEKNEEMYRLAKQHVAQFGQQKSITIEYGDAIEVISLLQDKQSYFDIIFIDAAKAQYQRYFEAVQSLTRKDSVIICDNVLFKGYVADETKNNNQRTVQLANKIRSFNSWLIKHPDYHTSILPIGDGVSISMKLQ